MSGADRFAATELALPASCRSELERHVTAGYPEEVCGLLIGRRDGDRVRVREVRPARNLNRERARDRYELAPEDFLAADRAARKSGLEIVGIWHSHPDHPARPSPTDLEAAWEGYSYLILSVERAGAAGRARVAEERSWRLSGERFREERILVDREPAGPINDGDP